MLSKGIADRYAKALLALAPTSKELDLFDNQLDAIIELDEKDPSLLRLISHPKITREQKRDLVRRIFSDTLTKHVLSLILLMIDKGRGPLLIDTAKRFSRIADEVRGVEKGFVYTAVPIPSDIFVRLEAEVQKHSERKIVLEQQIDEKIIGGAVVKLGNHVYDGSVRTRLRHFRDEMIKVNVLGKA